MAQVRKYLKKKELANYIKENGYKTIKELSSIMDVSMPTISKYLNELKEDGEI